MERKKRPSIPKKSTSVKRNIWDLEPMPKKARVVPTEVRAKKIPKSAAVPVTKRRFAEEHPSDESLEDLRQRVPKKNKLAQDAHRNAPRRAADSPWGKIEKDAEVVDRRKGIERRKAAAKAANEATRDGQTFREVQQAQARRQASPPRPTIPKKKKPPRS